MSRFRSIGFWTVFLALLFAPQGFDLGRPKAERFQPAWPAVYSGDEPHYLVMLHSLIQDGDLDLSNNYASVHDGSNQAGRLWSHQRFLDHHTTVQVEGSLRGWGEYFENGGWQVDPSRWVRDERGYLVPPPAPGAEVFPVGTPEYSTHPAGIALVLAPILYPLRNTNLVEPAAVLCSGLAVLLAALAFRWILRGYVDRAITIDLVTLVAFLGTPIWFYSRSFFNEPYLLLFAVGAYALALRADKGCPAGLLIGLGVLMKPTFVLLALPLVVWFQRRGAYRQIGWMVVPIVASVGVVLGLNTLLYGSWFTPPQPFRVGNPWDGLIGLMASARFGLLFFAPSVLLALACWPRFTRRFPDEAGVLLVGFLLQYVVMATWKFWDGWAYGPRHLVPVLPFLFAALVMWREVPWSKWVGTKLAILVLVAASFGINGLGALCYRSSWVSNPGIEWIQRKHPGLLPQALRDYYGEPTPTY